MNTGMQSRETGDEHIREVWARCDRMNAKRKEPGIFVPWEAVVVRAGLLPRKLDPEVVERYADAEVHLKAPAKVQAQTLVLIGGLHRRAAAPKAICDYMLVEEVECADEDLAWEAFEDNRTNAAPYKLAERLALIGLVLGRYPDWSNNEVARFLGIQPETVSRHRRRLEDAGEVDASETRRGADGKSYPAPPQVSRNGIPDRPRQIQPATISTPKRSAVSSFSPDAEPGYEEPSRTIDEPVIDFTEQGVERPVPSAVGAPPVELEGSSAVEPPAVNRVVEGSNPSPPANEEADGLDTAAIAGEGATPSPDPWDTHRKNGVPLTALVGGSDEWRAAHGFLPRPELRPEPASVAVLARVHDCPMCECSE